MHRSHTLADALRTRARTRPLAAPHSFLPSGEGAAVARTYADLDRTARALAVRLGEVASPGDRALVLCPPGLDFVAAVFGCFYAGVVAVPAPLLRRGERLGSIVGSARPRAALSPRSALSGPRPGAGIDGLAAIAVDEIDLAAAGDREPSDPDPDSVAILQYTSGSTGAPKGTAISHANLVANLEQILEAFGTRPGDRTVSWLPPFHDMGLVGGIFAPILGDLEATLFSPVAFLQKPIRWLAAISGTRARLSGGPNFAFDLAVRGTTPAEREGLDLSGWEVAFTGAERIRAGTLERFARAFEPHGFRREAFLPCYGLAEATLFVTGGPGPSAPATLPLPDGPGDVVGCGRPGTGVDLAIVDPTTLEPVPEGRIGEIWVAGPAVARGYWDLPEETARAFGATLPGREGTYLRTGDLGLVVRGELFVTGRIKDVIVLAGRKHSPEDIERTVEEAHPALRASASAAYAVDDGRQERLVVAAEVDRVHVAAVRADSGRAVLRAIRQAVGERHEVALHDVVLLRPGTLPRTTSGKVQRHACRAGRPGVGLLEGPAHE